MWREKTLSKEEEFYKALKYRNPVDEFYEKSGKPIK